MQRNMRTATGLTFTQVRVKSVRSQYDIARGSGGSPGELSFTADKATRERDRGTLSAWNRKTRAYSACSRTASRKNECFGGWFTRQLPLADAPAAARKYREFRAELVRWKGPPRAEDESPDWQRADWGDIRIKRAGRGVMIWVRSAGVADWWHRSETWAGDPLAEAWDWDAPPGQSR